MNYYIKDINKKLKLGNRLINTRKEFVCEKGKRSRVLMVYAISSEKDLILEEFSNTPLSWYQYASYQMITSD